MKVYLEVSVLIVYLFGQTKEPIRYEAVSNLFDKFQASQLDCNVSLPMNLTMQLAPQSPLIVSLLGKSLPLSYPLRHLPAVRSLFQCTR